MLWAINYTVDTGYDWKEHDCIVCACSEAEAKDILAQWARENLTGERYILDEHTKITAIPAERGVVWNSYFHKD